MNSQLFVAAIGVVEPGHAQEVDFDATKKTLAIIIEFDAGSLVILPQIC